MRLGYALSPLLGIAVIGVAISFAWTWQQGVSKIECKRLPDDSIYTTFSPDYNLIAGVGEFFRKNGAGNYKGIGPTTVFLVRAANVEEAGRATGRVLWGGETVDVILGKKEGSEASFFWLALYIDHGSNSPPRWAVQSVEQEGRIIRISLRKPPRNENDPIDLAHFVWVRLGRLDRGTYVLEVRNFNNNELIIGRRQEVIDE